MDLNGAATATFDIRTTAGSLTFLFEGTLDGVNYDIPLPAFAIRSLIAGTISAETYVSSVTVATTMTSTYIVGVTGLKGVQVRISAFTSGSINVAARASIADFIIYGKHIPSEFAVGIDGVVNTIATITLPAVAGLFHYITGIWWYRHSTAALVGTGAFNITTTNLPATMKWRIGNAIAIGENRIDVDFVPRTPLKSLLANTPTTIVAAAPGTGVLTTGLCTYYLGA
jgi:hypothetical protein